MLSVSLRPVRPALRVGLAALVAVSLSLPAIAQSGAATAPRGIAVVQLSNGATFNWLARKKAPQVTDTMLLSSDGASRLRKQRFFGKGSYICSPAGFGKKSRCFAR